MHTQVRARFLRRPSSGQRHFGAYPLYQVEEALLQNVHVDDRVLAGFERLGASAGVARPGTRHDAVLPWLPRDGRVQPSVSRTTPHQGPFRAAASEKRGRDDGRVQPSVSSTAQQDRVAAAKKRGGEVWE